MARPGPKPAVRAAAVLTTEIERGNAKRAAGKLDLDVTSVQRWVRSDPCETGATALVRSAVEEQSLRMAEEFEATALYLLRSVMCNEEETERLPVIIRKAGLRDRSVSCAIMIDKSRLLRGLATAISGHERVTDDELRQRMASLSASARGDTSQVPTQPADTSAGPVAVDLDALLAETRPSPSAPPV